MSFDALRNAAPVATAAAVAAASAALIAAALAPRAFAKLSPNERPLSFPASWEACLATPVSWLVISPWLPAIFGTRVTVALATSIMPSAIRLHLLPSFLFYPSKELVLRESIPSERPLFLFPARSRVGCNLLSYSLLGKYVP